jgi:hypothetical protein
MVLLELIVPKISRLGMRTQTMRRQRRTKKGKLMEIIVRAMRMAIFSLAV